MRDNVVSLQPSNRRPRRPPSIIAPIQGTLALDLQPRLEPPVSGEVVRLDQARAGEAQAWAQRFAQAAVEIVGGDRPVAQLLRWTTASVYADLSRRAQLVARAGERAPGLSRTQAPRPRVSSVRTCMVAPATVEACMRITHGLRSRALAARFELRQQRWVCTALQFS